MGEEVEGDLPAPFTAEQCAWLRETFSAGPSRTSTEDETTSWLGSQSFEPPAPHGPSTTGELLLSCQGVTYAC